TRRGNLHAQVVGGKNADRPQATGRGDGSCKLVSPQTAAHAGLNDRQLDPKSPEEGSHPVSRCYAAVALVPVSSYSSWRRGQSPDAAASLGALNRPFR